MKKIWKTHDLYALLWETKSKNKLSSLFKKYLLIILIVYALWGSVLLGLYSMMISCSQQLINHKMTYSFYECLDNCSSSYIWYFTVQVLTG